MGLESKFKKYFKWFKLVFKTDTLKKIFLEPEFWTKVPTFIEVKMHFNDRPVGPAAGSQRKSHWPVGPAAGSERVKQT